MLEVVYEHAEAVWKRWLGRRSSKHQLNWEQWMVRWQAICPLPKPRIVMSFECGQQRVMRPGWERPGSLALRRVLTNRMREYFTYGSVGGAGGTPGSYPAPNGSGPSRLQSPRLVAAVAELGSFVAKS